MGNLKIVDKGAGSDGTCDVIRGRIRNMSIALIEPEDIASALGVSVKFLYEKYGFELQNARTLAAEQLVGVLMSKAVDDGDSSAAKFLLSRQPAWRHYMKEQINVTLKDACLKDKSAALENETFQPLKLKPS